VTESPEDLRARQEAREREERERAEQAAEPDEEDAAGRRAEKAGYLKEKLSEQVQSDSE
jgi:hypothetical protein